MCIRIFKDKGLPRCCAVLERSAAGDIVVHASITAKPFFINRGYIEKKKQRVLRRGVWLENYVMVKLRKR